jgi:hypothetical protein
MNDMVCCGRHEVFLGERLEAVSQRLEDAIGSHPVGSVTILYAAEAFPLEKRADCK